LLGVDGAAASSVWGAASGVSLQEFAKFSDFALACSTRTNARRSRRPVVLRYRVVVLRFGCPRNFDASVVWLLLNHLAKPQDTWRPRGKMATDIKYAVLVGTLTVAISTVLLAPLDQASTSVRPVAADLGEMAVGGAVAGVVTLFALVVPTLVSLRWFIGRPRSFDRWIWMGVGGLVVLTLMMVLDRLVATMWGWSSVQLAAPWPALILGGGVCGWFVFPTTADKAAQNAAAPAAAALVNPAR